MFHLPYEVNSKIEKKVSATGRVGYNSYVARMDCIVDRVEAQVDTPEALYVVNVSVTFIS